MLFHEKDLIISELLIDWYRKNKRELPWRDTTDPYVIWISEIILQQTRVAQGIDYFHRFIERFPNVGSLAAAAEDEVLKYWQGLGYYSRARNLHQAAKTIVSDYQGIFPSDYAAIRTLKGIGDYTAAAITSFAWNQPYPVVDGNVFRVLSRLFALDTPIDTTKGKKQFTGLAHQILNPLRANLHNQAIMELGALQCVPKNPDCMSCPLQAQCLAFASQTVASFPVKQGKTKVRNRYFNYLFLRYGDKTWLRRRGDKDIWEGLYEFPLIETEQALPADALLIHPDFQTFTGNPEQLSVSVALTGVKHVLSHQIIYASFYQIDLSEMPQLPDTYQQIDMNELEKYPVSRLIHIYLEKLDLDLLE